MDTSKSMKKFGEDYSYIKYIDGGGSFGTIYLVSKNTTNKEYIAKVIDEEKKYSYENEKKINEIVKQLNNPNIVEYIKSKENEYIEIEDDYKDFIIFEYCSRGELLEYVIFSGGFEEKIAKIIFKTILETVEKLHNIGIYHLDLKLDNILVDKEFNIKIADFGLSKQKDENNNGIFSGEIGAEVFRPPQMFIKSNFYGDKSDIFSLGVILFNLVTAIHGFENSSPNNYYYNLLQENKKEYWEDFEKYLKENKGKILSKQFKDLYEKMVSYKEENRPDIKDLLKYEWFNEINNLTDEKKKQIIKEVFEKKEIIVEKNKERRRF